MLNHPHDSVCFRALPCAKPCHLSCLPVPRDIVKRRVGRLTYELVLPDNMIIHPVISVAHSLPTPAGKGPFDRPVPPLGPVEDSQSDRSEDSEPGDDFEVEVTLDYETVRRAHKCLIK